MTDASDYQWLSGMMRGRIVASRVITPDSVYEYDVDVLDTRWTGGTLTGARNEFKPLPDSIKLNAAPNGTNCIVFITQGSYAIWVPEKPFSTECADAPDP